MKVRLSKDLTLKHKWDGETFSEDGYPISECGERLLPRDVKKILATYRAARDCKECYGRRRTR